MSTPSKEALEAAKELFPDAISFYRFVAENAAEIAELKKQEAESRRLFYAEQDKRQSAEQRNAELDAALRETLDDPNSTISGALYYRMEQVLARAETATPDHIRDAAQMVPPAKEVQP